MYEEVKTDEVVLKYLPEFPPNSNKLPERKFFYGIIATLLPEYLQQAIQQARHSRFDANEAGKEEESIVVANKWLSELMQYPVNKSKLTITASFIYFLAKRGTAVFLLKKNSKFR